MLDYRERQKLIEEQRLRAKLTEPPPRTTAWKIANAPFTLWLLSSVAIAVITATITQEQACSKDFERDSLDFRKLSDEIPGRNRLLFKRLASTQNEAEYNNSIEQFEAGETFYVYSEYKGKSIIELSLMRSNLEKKLHPVWTGKNLLVCRVELQDTEPLRMKSSECTATSDTPSVQVESEPRYGAGKIAAPYKWGVPQARGYGAVDQVLYFKYLKSTAFKAYQAYSTQQAYLDLGQYWDIPNGGCSLRSLWSRMLGISGR